MEAAEMKVVELIDELEEIVRRSNTVPLSNKKIMINPDDIMDIIDEIRMRLPEEVLEARRVKQEESRIITAAQTKAKALIENAVKKQRELIDSDEVAKNAYNQAEQTIKESEEKGKKILTKAETNAKELVGGSAEYAESVLKKVQDELKRINDILEENRSQLKSIKRKNS
jgi:vacuolar-type H+-ATPase subunit H